MNVVVRDVFCTGNRENTIRRGVWSWRLLSSALIVPRLRVSDEMREGRSTLSCQSSSSSSELRAACEKVVNTIGRVDRWAEDILISDVILEVIIDYDFFILFFFDFFFFQYFVIFSSLNFFFNSILISVSFCFFFFFYYISTLSFTNISILLRFVRLSIN